MAAKQTFSTNFSLFHKKWEANNISLAWIEYEEGSNVPPVVQDSKVSSFNLSILPMIPWNSPNGKIDDGHIWVGSTIQTIRKKNASNRKISSNN